MTRIENLIGKKINKVFLVVWPPVGEDRLSDVDISIGFVFDEDDRKLCVVSTDRSDMCSPIVSYEDLPNDPYHWSLFDERMKHWMSSLEFNFTGREYYDFTDAKIFDRISHNEVNKVELVLIEGDPEPFGLKFIFEDDYILSTPISNGNTIETSSFNKNDNISHFKSLGSIEYKLFEKLTF